MKQKAAILRVWKGKIGEGQEWERKAEKDRCKLKPSLRTRALEKEKGCRTPCAMLKGWDYGKSESVGRSNREEANTRSGGEAERSRRALAGRLWSTN